jgi:2-polyprenyl-3-methyl-5-hydroxy-6-metoxy-1,4-benzoquinol methylase
MNTNQFIYCRICKSSNCHNIFLANSFDNLKDSSRFQYFNCYDCNTIFLNTIPKNIAEYYNQNYAPYQRSEKIQKHIKKNIDIIKKFGKNCKVLEIGPGNGEFIVELAKENYECFALEPDMSSKKFLEKNGIKVINNKLEDLKIDSLQFEVDIIVAWHVIEHLENLNIFIKLCEKILNKGGHIILSTPNTDSLSFNIFKKYWYQLEAPKHFFMIKEKKLDQIMTSNYFNKVTSYKRDYTSIYNSKFGWETSAYYFSKVKKNKIYSYFGKILSLFMPYIEALLNKTAQYICVYKK